MRNRVLVIGLDGTTFDLISPWIKKGILSNFSAIIKKGVFGRLESTIPYTSPVAWASFATGVNPGKHGVFGFFQKGKNGSLTPTSRKTRKGEAFWDILSQNDYKIGLVNVPGTYPPGPINGFIVSGMFTPNERSVFTYPINLKTEILTRFPKYKISVKGREYIANDRPDLALREINEMFENRYETVKYFIKEKKWDFFCVNFLVTDSIQHCFWRYMDSTHPLYDKKESSVTENVILNLYQKIDQSIGELFSTFDDNVIKIVMSDHGMGPTNDKVIYLNKWLAENQYLNFKTPPNTLNSKIKRSVIKLSLKILPSHLANKIKRIILASSSYNLLNPWNIDYFSTKAYADENMGSIYINLKEREKHGIIRNGEEYKELEMDIIQRLKELKDPETGELIIKKIYQREELWKGPYITSAPDLIIELKNPGYQFASLISANIQSPVVKENKELLKKRISATHRRNGILIINGEGIKSKFELKNARIIDLAPTILHIFGIPIPKYMDGKVLRDIFEVNSELMKRKIEYESERERVKNKINTLKSIGKI